MGYLLHSKPSQNWEVIQSHLKLIHDNPKPFIHSYVLEHASLYVTLLPNQIKN